MNGSRVSAGRGTYIAADRLPFSVDDVDSVIGTDKTTAQVTPGDFTRSIAEEAHKSGVEITIASVTDLIHLTDGMMEVVAETDEGQREVFHATDVVFAAGPWTGKLANELLGEEAGAAGDIVPR